MSRPSSEGKEDSSDPRADWFQLTRRELQVLDLVKLCLTNEEISSLLRVRVNALKNHLWNIRLKTGVKDRAELVYRLSGLGPCAPSRSSTAGQKGGSWPRRSGQQWMSSNYVRDSFKDPKFRRKLFWWSQRGSNPRFRLERPAS